MKRLNRFIAISLVLACCQSAFACLWIETHNYYLFHVQEAIFGTGFAGWWKYVIFLLLFLFVPLLGMRRLKDAYINQNYPKD